MNEENAKIHEFAPMEEFLIDFFKNRRRKLYTIDFEEYFEENPLTEENYKKIIALLEPTETYKAICAKYGIGTKKLDCKEYAKEYGIEEWRAQAAYDAVTRYFRADFSVRLYYMALRPHHLRRYVFETQFELHNMMKAYDELTGKNTAYEHHVGVCEGPALGRDLFRYGYDTLEEIQKVDRGFLADDKYGLKDGIAYRVSEVLVQYGLENTLWRGTINCVSDMIYTIEDYDAVKIFFRTKKIQPDVDAMRDVLNGLVYNGDCSGYDADRLLNGDVWIHFNPIRHDAGDRKRAIEKVVTKLNEYIVFSNEE